MKGRELKAIRSKLELSQAKLGELLGVDRNTIARYERSELRVPEPVARLARIAGGEPVDAVLVGKPAKRKRQGVR